MKKIKSFIKKYIPKVAIVGFALGIISALALVLSIVSKGVADALNSTVGTAFRAIMSSFSSPFSFSWVEILICISPVLLILIAVLLFFKLRTKRAAIRVLFVTLSLPAFIFSGFVFALGIPYHTTGIAEKMQISEVEVTKDNLKATAIILRDETNALAEELQLSDASESVMDMSWRELSQNITDAYDVFAEDYGFPFNFYTRAKPLIFDEVMSEAHLLGIYTFFTGESNINDGYPDYNLPFVVAHEFAHQRGIIREDEANFLAFAVCIRSDDPYVRYSGYLNMYEYTINALYKTDYQAFKSVHRELCYAAFADIRASSEYSKQFADSALGEAVGNVNDAYLQMNGTPGRISYSLSVRLTVAYYS